MRTARRLAVIRWRGRLVLATPDGTLAPGEAMTAARAWPIANAVAGLDVVVAAEAIVRDDDRSSRKPAMRLAEARLPGHA